MNNNKTVFFAIGILLIILGVFMLIPFVVEFIYDEDKDMKGTSSWIKYKSLIYIAE